MNVNRSISKIALSVIIATGGLFSHSLLATDLYVSLEHSENNHYNTLREALQAAKDNDTIILKKEVVEDYRNAPSSTQNNRQIYRIDKQVTIKGEDPNAHKLLRFDGYHDIVLSKDVTLKNVDLFIQPTEDSLSSAIGAAGTGTANELDPKIYLNGHKLVLDNVNTKPKPVANQPSPHEFTRPNIYLGAYTGEQDAGNGTLEVTNTSNNNNVNTDLKHIIANSANSTISLNTNTDVLKDIHFSTDKENGQAFDGTVNLKLDSYRKNLRVQKQGNPTINLEAKDTAFNSFPENLGNLNNLTLEGSKTNLPVTTPINVANTLTLKNGSTLEVGNSFDDDGEGVTATIKNIAGEGGSLKIENASSVNVSGTVSGSIKVEDSNSGNTGFNVPEDSSYERAEGDDGTYTYQPRQTPPSDHSEDSPPSNKDESDDRESQPPSTGISTDSGTGTSGTVEGSGEIPDNQTDPKIEKEDTPDSTKDTDDPDSGKEGNDPNMSGGSSSSSTTENEDSETEEKSTDQTDKEDSKKDQNNPQEDMPNKNDQSSTTAQPSAPALKVVDTKPIFELFTPHLLLNQLQNPNRAVLNRAALPFEGKNVWVTVEHHYAKQKQTHRSPEYKMKDSGFSLGIEAEVAKGKLGASLSYSQPHFTATKQGQLKAKTWQAFIYGNATVEQAVAYGYAGMGYSYLISQNFNTEQQSHFHATVVQSGLGVAYPVKFNQVTLTPSLEVNYAWLRTSAQTTQDFTIPERNLQSLIVRSGLALAVPLSENLTFNAQAAVGVETLNQNLKFSYVDAQTRYQMETKQPQRFSSQLGLGVSYRFSPATMLQVGYQAEMKKGYYNHNANLSLQVKF